MPITRERPELVELHVAVQAGEPLAQVAERNGIPASTLSAFSRRASARVNVATAPLWAIPANRLGDLLATCKWDSPAEGSAVSTALLRLARGRAHSHGLLGNLTSDAQVGDALEWAATVHGWRVPSHESARVLLAQVVDAARGIERTEVAA